MSISIGRMLSICQAQCCSLKYKIYRTKSCTSLLQFQVLPYHKLHRSVPRAAEVHISVMSYRKNIITTITICTRKYAEGVKTRCKSRPGNAHCPERANINIVNHAKGLAGKKKKLSTLWKEKTLWCLLWQIKFIFGLHRAELHPSDDQYTRLLPFKS